MAERALKRQDDAEVESVAPSHGEHQSMRKDRRLPLRWCIMLILQLFDAHAFFHHRLPAIGGDGKIGRGEKAGAARLPAG
jgi:hypothetical protein